MAVLRGLFEECVKLLIVFLNIADLGEKRSQEPFLTLGLRRCIACACQDHDGPPKAA